MKTVLIILGMIAVISTTAEAQRVFRCNGMVQFYPCGQELFKKRPTTRSTSTLTPRPTGDPRARAALTGPGPDAYAEIVKKSYQKSGSQGWWRGTVKGNGQVHLQLEILRHGAIESTRYMGHVVLKNKSTWFSFKSPLPRGQGWSWDIRAYAL